MNKVIDLMLKRKQVPVVIELTVILSHSYVYCDMTISFLSILRKLPSRCLMETNQSLRYYLETSP